MIANLAEAPRAPSASRPSLKLTALFWAFSYALLSIRSAIFHDNWGRLLDNYRLLAVTIGAVAYALVLRQLDARHRVTLRTALAWIIAATFAVTIVRVTIDEYLFDVPQGVGLNLLWSLTWSAYFGLWTMGALAFAPVNTAAPEAVPGRTEVRQAPANLDALEQIIEGIVAEASEFTTAERDKLAKKIIAMGGYEAAEGTERDNDRARLALRIAARLSARG
jgi:hypothetical protein